MQVTLSVFFIFVGKNRNMNVEQKLNEKQGHWILAKLGKRVLRPGGRELTEKLVKNLNINKYDDIVEFAPGLGFTAKLTCDYHPKTYTGVDINEEAASLARKSIQHPNAKIIIAEASNTTLPDESATKVYGEAMLTMQTLENKKAIIKEAYRILKPNGYYGIHELGIKPDNIGDDIKQEIFKELSSNIRVHARPMTTSEWIELIEEAGFKIVKVEHNRMLLLEASRILKDEGFLRTIKFCINLVRFPELTKRVLKMRKIFRKHEKNLDSIVIIAQK